MTKRPANMSQLDYLWTHFGEYSVSSTPSIIPSGNVILTEEAIVNLITKAESGGIVNIIYRNHPTDSTLVQLVGTSIDGTELTVVTMPKVDNVIYFGATTVTTEDIDKGCPYEIGTNVLKLQLKSGISYYFNLDAFMSGNTGYTGAETDTIITNITNKIITSELKLKTTTNVVQLVSDSEGLFADLNIDSEDTGVSLTKSNKGLSARIPFGTTNQIVRFEQLSLASYTLLDTKVSGTLYFITDKPYIYLNGIRYGIDMAPGEVPIVSLVYDADHCLLSYKKADGSDIVNIHLGFASEEMSGMLSAEDYTKFNEAYTQLEWNNVYS